jgi:hypothetical protein
VSKVVAATGAGAVFVGAVETFHMGLLLDSVAAAPLAAVTGLIIWRFWPGQRPATAQDIKDLYKAMDNMNTGGIPTEEVVGAIRMGTEKLDRILMEANQIKAPNTQRRIKHIDAIGRKIIEDFRIDPKDVRLAQSWLNSYLDETITLIRGYAQLSRTGARSIEAQKQMAQFDEMLDTIEVKFQELLDRLLSNDVMDFDVNMTVMKNRLNNEGI